MNEVDGTFPERFRKRYEYTSPPQCLNLYYVLFRVWVRDCNQTLKGPHPCEPSPSAGAQPIIQVQFNFINHWRDHNNTGRSERINNKIKIIKWKVYGFNDIEYFSLGSIL